MSKTEHELKAEMLTAIGHPNRIRILECLRGGTKCNCELMQELKLEQSNLSRHLKALVDAGILISWKDGVRVNYRIADKQIFDLLDLAGTLTKKYIEKKLKAFKKP